MKRGREGAGGRGGGDRGRVEYTIVNRRSGYETWPLSLLYVLRDLQEKTAKTLSHLQTSYAPPDSLVCLRDG